RRRARSLSGGRARVRRGDVGSRAEESGNREIRSRTGAAAATHLKLLSRRRKRGRARPSSRWWARRVRSRPFRGQTRGVGAEIAAKIFRRCDARGFGDAEGEHFGETVDELGVADLVAAAHDLEDAMNVSRPPLAQLTGGGKIGALGGR